MDPETGVTEIVSWVAVDDFGNIVNPMIVEGQVHGGVAHGVGQALLEGCAYDAEGQLLTGSFMDYTMPRADDLPDMTVETTCTPCPHNPLGVKGCGEAGAIAAPSRGHERGHPTHSGRAPSTCRRRRTRCGGRSTHRSDPSSQVRSQVRDPPIRAERSENMYEFNYHRPGTLEAAVAAFAAASDARVLAGGQTLIPTLKQRLASPSDVIDLGGIAGLQGVRREGGALVVGAMTRHADVASSPEAGEAIPALAALADGIGDPQVRNAGTIGGSIANADPAADYPAAVVGLGATVTTDRRTIAGDDFFTGLFETALEEGEIVVSVSFPVPRRAAYAKFPNPASRYAIVGVLVAETGGGVRVAVTGAGGPGVPGGGDGGSARRRLPRRRHRRHLRAEGRAQRGPPRERRVPRPPGRRNGPARGRRGGRRLILPRGSNPLRRRRVPAVMPGRPGGGRYYSVPKDASFFAR